MLSVGRPDRQDQCAKSPSTHPQLSLNSRTPRQLILSIGTPNPNHPLLCLVEQVAKVALLEVLVLDVVAVRPSHVVSCEVVAHGLLGCRDVARGK